MTVVCRVRYNLRKRKESEIDSKFENKGPPADQFFFSKSCKKRTSLLRAYKCIGDPLRLSQYKYVTNLIVAELRKTKLLFFKQLPSVDVKTFWKLCEVLTRREFSILVL